MRITVHVKPNARRTGVSATGKGELTVAVTAPPAEGKANEAVIEALASHFGVPRSRVQILHGLKGRRKVVEIAD